MGNNYILEIERLKIENNHLRQGLTLAEQKFNMLADAVCDVIWEIDSNARYTYVSPSVEKILGFTPEEIIGKTPFDLLPPKDYQDLKGFFDEVQEKQLELKGFINTNVCKDGHTVKLETFAHPFYDKDGNIAGYRGVDRDVTEKMKIQEIVLSTAEQLKSVVEITNNGVWNWNLKTNGTTFSEKYYTMLGFEPNEFPANFDSWQGLVHVEDLGKILGLIKSHIDNRSPMFEDEFRVKTKQGTWKWIKTVGKIVEFDANGCPITMLGVHIDIDEQKRNAEQKLDLLGVAVNSASNGIIITDINGIIEFANPAFLVLTQYSINEVIGQKPGALVKSGEYTSEFYRQMWDTILSGNTWNGEIINKKKNGELYHEDLTITPVKNAEGIISNFIAIKHDISFKKQIQRKLDQTNAELKAIYDNSPVMTCLLDSDQKIKYANQAILSFLGNDIEQLYNWRACGAFGCINALEDTLGCGFGQSCADCKLNIAINDTFKNGTSHRDIEHYTTLNIQGVEKQYVLLGSSSLIDMDSEKFVLLNLLDITSRKQAELNLLNSEKMFRAYVQTAPYGIFVVNRQGNFQGANAEITRMLITNEEELLKTNLHDYVHHHNIAFTDIFLQETQESNSISHEILMVRTNGMKFWANLHTVWLGANELLFFCEDINLRKQIEEEQEELLDALRVSNETIEAALYQKNSLIHELEMSRNELTNAIAAKDKFFSIISHDLRGPFSGFLGLSDMLAKDLEELSVKDLKKMSIAIYNSANSVYKLLDDLLQWSRVQTGTIPFSPELIDIHHIAVNASYILSEMASKKNIEVNISIPNPIFVYCDNNMITTIIRNLLTNAIKFTNTGGAIEIGLSSQSDSQVEISIKDNGVGIKPENISKLFRIDQQYSTKGTASESGSGLGLILCKEFVDKHNGVLRVESKLQEGTTFFVSLPTNNQSAE